jgi:hypothetical protein
MQRTEVPDLESYEQREDWRQPENRTAWPIDDPPPGREMSSKPKLKSGDLVEWVQHPDSSLKDGWYTPMWKDKHVGLVLLTRWVLSDWVRWDRKQPKLYPEALILWGDGGTTNTSQSLLRAIE